MIKTSLGLSFVIQFKEKTPNNILIISTLTFTLYVTSPNVLGTSLNLNSKKPNVLYVYMHNQLVVYFSLGFNIVSND